MVKQLGRRIAGMALALLLGAAALLPLAVQAADLPPETEAGAYVVMDADTGQVLISKNADALGYPASITKIMTMGLVLESGDYEAQKDGVVKASEAAIAALIPRATMISLSPGENATLQDLLYATMIESANDAANVLAEHMGGSIEGFGQLMNSKAAELGLTGTHFTNPSGQPEDEHYTTARDMAEILRWAMSIDGFAEIFGAQRYAMGATNKQPGGRIFNNANLLTIPDSTYYCPGVVGSKTGYTDQAMYTLATYASRDGMNLIAVVLNCPMNSIKYTSTNDLLDYCFANFRRVSVPASDIVTHSVPVYGGGEKPLGQIDVYAEGEVEFLLHNSLAPSLAQFTCDVPEKYVIGQAFTPTATLTLGDVQQQDSIALGNIGLVWNGLDEILAENTGATALGRMAGEKPLAFWLGIIIPCLVVGSLAGRIIYVQIRRKRRRRQRILAAQELQALRIAEQIPGTNRPRSAYRRPASTPELRVAKNSAYSGGPRRVGRAR